MRWYEKALPSIENAMSIANDIAEQISSTPGVKNIYAWGSLAKYAEHKSFPIKDVDILIACDFHSGDLLAIDEEPGGTFEIPANELEEEGFNKHAVSFTKKFIKSSKRNIDHWVISSDNKLLHWGQISDTTEELKEYRKLAENITTKEIGIHKNQLDKTNYENRKNWFSRYYNFLKSNESKIPIGWYEINYNENNENSPLYKNNLVELPKYNL